MVRFFRTLLEKDYIMYYDVNYIFGLKQQMSVLKRYIITGPSPIFTFYLWLYFPSAFFHNKAKLAGASNDSFLSNFDMFAGEAKIAYFKLLDILNIDSTFKLKISLLAHKISQNEANISEVSQNYLIKVSDIHSPNTRYASNLNFHVPRVG